MDEQTDVLIVGGGLIGLALAAALSDTNLKVALVDRAREPAMAPIIDTGRTGFTLVSGVSPRVSALSNGTREFLTRSGVWQRLPENRLLPYVRMDVRDGEGTGNISFHARDTGESQLGTIAQNQDVALALCERCAEGQVKLHWDTEIDRMEAQDDGYLVTSQQRSWHTSLIVGADGSQSRVRQLVNLPAVKWNYDQHAVVTTIETELSHGQTARQWFTGDGILAFLPLPDSHLCSIVFSTRDSENWLKMSDQAFALELDRLSEQALGHVVGIDKRASFPLSQQHSLRYVDANLALIGDAAHTIHPLAGQGANIGLADAQALAQMIKKARLQHRTPGDPATLREYQNMRRPDNMLTAAVMEAFARGYGVDNPGVAWLRNKGMSLVNDNDLLRKMVTKLATSR